MTGIVLAGALAGIGVFLLAIALVRPSTRGAGAATALARMDADRRRQRLAGRPNLTGPAVPRPRNVVSSVGASIRRQLEAVGIPLPATLRADLALVDRSLDAYLAYTVLGGLAGGLVSLVLAGLAAAFVPILPVFTPALVVLLGVLVGALLPTAAVASRAGVRRRDFRHVVGSFLDLVALNLSGGRGVPEALTSASQISDGWAMIRLRETLEAARLAGVTPWAALGELGQQTQVDELRDLAAALELVADDGAKIRESLAARATSLRRRELADAEGRAQARSQSMLVAQMLLAVGFLTFLVYPAVVRVLGS
jgi:tight adherence protein C